MGFSMYQIAVLFWVSTIVLLYFLVTFFLIIGGGSVGLEPLKVDVTDVSFIFGISTLFLFIKKQKSQIANDEIVKLHSRLS